MSATTDSGLVKTMMAVMAALAVFFFVAIIAANMLAGDNEISAAAEARQLARIAPVGQVRTKLDEAASAAAAPAAEATQAAAAPKSGEELVNTACAACHASGVANAPKIGDAAEWSKRAEAGMDALMASVINGKGAMPPRGGSALSDDELRLAVEHLLGQ